MNRKHNAPTGLILFPFILLTCLFNPCRSQQDFDRYSLIRQDGDMPDEFVRSSMEKVNAEISKLNRNLKRSDKQIQENFILQSNFGIDELLLSGKVLYNDEVTQYLERVADYILRDNPDLRKKLRFYAVRTPVVNAFATNNGIIFVNMGLLAQIENEAQLAFVLCHEIQHYIKKHPASRYVEKENIRKGKGLYNKLTFDEKLLALSRYSKEQETEADKEGFKLFSGTIYDPGQAESVFDVLLLAEYPFDDQPFDSTFLQKGLLTLPSTCMLKTIEAIAPADDEDEKEKSEGEKRSTHPSVRIRREYIIAMADKLENKGEALFLFGEEDFNRVRKICRFESIHEQNSYLQYEKALYNCFLLMKDDPESHYLRKNVVRALYGLSKYKNRERFEQVHRDTEVTQGEFEAVPWLFEKLNGLEITSIALAHAWELYRQDTTDRELRLITLDLFAEMSIHYKDKMRNFLHELPSANKNEVPEEVEVKSEKKAEPARQLTKYEKIKKAREDKAEGISPVNPDELEKGFIYSAFIHLFTEPDFSRLWAQAAQGKFGQREKYTKEEWKAHVKKARASGKTLAREKVVYLDPIYQMVDQRKDIPVRYEATVEKKQEFIQTFNEMNDRLNMKYQMLQVSELKKDQTEKFIDNAILQDWLAERFRHDDVEGMVNTHTNEVYAIAEKYKTPYFGWTGAFSITERKSMLSRMVACYGSICLPILPFTLYYALTPKVNTYYFTAVFNVDQNDISYGEFRHINMKPAKDIMRSSIYQVLYNLKGQPK